MTEDKPTPDEEVEERRDVQEGIDAPSTTESEARKAEAELEIKRLEVEQERAQREQDIALREQDAQQYQAKLAQEARAEAAARREQEKQRTEQEKLALERMKLRWSVDRIRGQVSLILIGGFLATTLIVVGANIIGQAAPDLLQTVSTLYSGITGAVLGYYFGRQQQ